MILWPKKLFLSVFLFRTKPGNEWYIVVNIRSHRSSVAVAVVVVVVVVVVAVAVAVAVAVVDGGGEEKERKIAFPLVRTGGREPIRFVLFFVLPTRSINQFRRNALTVPPPLPPPPPPPAFSFIGQPIFSRFSHWTRALDKLSAGFPFGCTVFYRVFLFSIRSTGISTQRSSAAVLV